MPAMGVERTRGRWLGCAFALALGPGCELSRPEGSYTPPPELEPAPSKPKPPPTLDNDELPSLDLGGDGAGDGSGDGAGDGAADGSDPETPLEALQHELSGDYWMRVDLHSSAKSNGINVTTHTTTFSLVRVGLDGEDASLKMIDWQCSIANVQKCSFPCTSASSTVAAGEGRAYRPAVRTLTVDPDSGRWSSTLVPFAMSWEGNYAEEPDAVLPTDESDPRIYDTAGNGLGMNIDVAVVTGISTTRCTARLVQKIGLAYSGTLVDRAFSRGDVTEKGSEQTMLHTTCPPDISGSQTAAYTLRLARAPQDQPIDESWSCPSDSAFKSLLPQP